MRVRVTRWRGIVRIAAFAAISLLPFCVSANAQNHGAEAFIEQNTSSAISILKNQALSQSEKRSRMEALISSLLDLKRMALFTLGPAAKTAPPADIEAFIVAYRDFALANYTAELSGYTDQVLQVTGSMQRAPGDYIVNGVVRDPRNKTEEPAEVTFRVLDEGNGKLSLVDAAVEGVWFTLAQRDDFTGFLGQNGGDVAKLAAHLKSMANRAGAANGAEK